MTQACRFVRIVEHHLMTRFKAIRNFLRRPGETVMAGDVLTLDDAEAIALVTCGVSSRSNRGTGSA